MSAGSTEETPQHFVLECPAYIYERRSTLKPRRGRSELKYRRSSGEKARQWRLRTLFWTRRDIRKPHRSITRGREEGQETLRETPTVRQDMKRNGLMKHIGDGSTQLPHVRRVEQTRYTIKITDPFPTFTMLSCMPQDPHYLYDYEAAPAGRWFIARRQQMRVAEWSRSRI